MFERTRLCKLKVQCRGSTPFNEKLSKNSNILFKVAACLKLDSSIISYFHFEFLHSIFILQNNVIIIYFVCNSLLFSIPERFKGAEQ